MADPVDHVVKAARPTGPYGDGLGGAVRAHRRREHDDLVSPLIAEGCSDTEILGECLTFAAAGRVTTRELIRLAACHLFSDADLPHHHRSADEGRRLTDVFLSRLFALDGIRMKGQPRVAFREAIGGHEIRGLSVGFPRAGRRRPARARFEGPVRRQPPRAPRTTSLASSCTCRRWSAPRNDSP
ncbi:hypothetical protein ACIQ1J_23195 [Streptomyces sp. NPDC097107]|uniref:hypothetical protein n=1 Tax=Streptomyces sp. NPDC097107 TaxID=3366089 RepID=UPI00380C712C